MPKRLMNNDAKLPRVAQALSNVFRMGTTYTTSETSCFPIPAIACRGAVDELPLALGERGTCEFKTHAIRTNPCVWEIDVASLELRNLRWDEFLNRTMDQQRETLGISPQAEIEYELRKMTLVEAGGRLDLTQDHRHRGRFGFVVIVLPSTFTDGEFVIKNVEKKGDKCLTQGEPVTWRVDGRPYDISYGFFHQNCVVQTGIVRNGAAFYLVYDLITTTPTDIPLFAGPEAVQQAVNEALSDYFDCIPVPLTKRRKIGPDAWRFVNEFANERPFVYIVNAKTFDNLDQDEAKIAQSLEAFCAQSGGQFVLYHVGLLAMREASADNTSSDESHSRLAEIQTALNKPWLKRGENVHLMCPPILLCPNKDIAPMGQVDRFPLTIPPYSLSFDATDVFGRQDDKSMRTVFETHALVVVPVSVETRQLANLPWGDTIARLNSLLSNSFDDGIRYARSVIQHGMSMFYYTAGWTDFFKILVQINDCQLFNELLSVMKFDRSQQAHRALCDAIYHFGWVNCEGTLKKRVETTPKMCNRVNVITSVAYEGIGAENLNPLLDALLSLHPWTDFESRHNSYDSTGRAPYKRLLEIVYRESPGKFEQIATVPHRTAMLQVALKGFEGFVFDLRRAKPFWKPIFIRVIDHARTMIEAEFREPFETICIPSHCHKCSELQSFLSSTATETTIRFTGATQREHIDQVIGCALEHLIGRTIEVELVEAKSVRLKKTGHNELQFAFDSESFLRDLFTSKECHFFTDNVKSE